MLYNAQTVENLIESFVNDNNFTFTLRMNENLSLNEFKQHRLLTSSSIIEKITQKLMYLGFTGFHKQCTNENLKQTTLPYKIIYAIVEAINIKNGYYK